MTSGIPKGKRKLTDEELKANRRRRSKEYEQTEERKLKKHLLQQTPEFKKKMKLYNDRNDVKTKRKLRSLTSEFKKNRKKRESTPEKILKTKTKYDTQRLLILQKYSKRLSNSNVPCCNCCGLNSHIAFLAIDHIAGKRKMDSEPELVKLGYESTFPNSSLKKWIVDNNFPKGFQILCHSCNHAKGHTKNKKCPMENKPH
jgi:hypothetical protein